MGQQAVRGLVTPCVAREKQTCGEELKRIAACLQHIEGFLTEPDRLERECDFHFQRAGLDANGDMRRIELRRLLWTFAHHMGSQELTWEQIEAAAVIGTVEPQVPVATRAEFFRCALKTLHLVAAELRHRAEEVQNFMRDGDLDEDARLRGMGDRGLRPPPGGLPRQRSSSSGSRPESGGDEGREEYPHPRAVLHAGDGATATGKDRGMLLDERLAADGPHQQATAAQEQARHTAEEEEEEDEEDESDEELDDEQGAPPPPAAAAVGDDEPLTPTSQSRKELRELFGSLESLNKQLTGADAAGGEVADGGDAASGDATEPPPQGERRRRRNKPAAERHGADSVVAAQNGHGSNARRSGGAAPPRDWPPDDRVAGARDEEAVPLFAPAPPELPPAVEKEEPVLFCPAPGGSPDEIAAVNGMMALVLNVEDEFDPQRLFVGRGMLTLNSPEEERGTQVQHFFGSTTKGRRGSAFDLATLDAFASGLEIMRTPGFALLPAYARSFEALSRMLVLEFESGEALCLWFPTTEDCSLCRDAVRAEVDRTVAP